MKISAICVTYARVSRLQEAIAAYLNQEIALCDDYELVVLNTCPQQTLTGDFPHVRIINLTERPKSLGEARNIAIEAVTGDVCVIWDDDDVALAGHLRAYAETFGANPDCDWVLLAEQFYAERDRIIATSPGACHMLAFTKKAWRDVGGYPPIGSGEDRVLTSAISQKFKGVKITLPTPTYIYGWDNSVYHSSGMGNDRPGQKPLHDRIEQDFIQRRREGREPVGKILLKPALKQDYEGMARAFLASRKSSETKMAGDNSVCVVMLGRAGDIVNALAFCKKLHEQGKQVYMMISREFAELLEGVSYVIPYPVNLPFDELSKGIELAKSKFGENVIVAQIYGKGYAIEKRTESFAVESWRCAGVLKHYHDPEWPLVFDRRSPKREDAIARRLFRRNQPIILSNLTRATTSPFSKGQDIATAIAREFSPPFECVDIGNQTFPRMFDVVGLIDRAAVFVSIDTGTAHLAPATNTPLVLLTPGPNWGSTNPRFNCAAVINYADATPHAVIMAIRKALDYKLQLKKEAEKYPIPKGEMLFHHSGDTGDILYGLTAIKAMGGGVLVISPDTRYPVRVRPTPEHFENLAPLLRQQSYLKSVLFAPRRPVGMGIDMNTFRANFRMHGGLARMQQELFGVTWPEDKPWMEVDRPVKVSYRPICVNRSARYHNNAFPWEALVEKWGSKMFFVGSEAEHAAFSKEFGGGTLYIHTPTMLDVARLVAGAKVCVGNQSSPLAIAHALCRPVVQEVLVEDNNCNFHRPFTIYNDQEPARIPEEWLL